jgi:thiamine biosynthesis lipoprotein
MELDFGGLGKEYAADRAAEICRKHGLLHALVDLGGDLAVVGPLPDGLPWKIHVRHPLHPNEALTIIAVSQGGVATSGNYEHCIEIAGNRFSHILNPLHGFPVQEIASVTVVAGSCRLAGGLSTIAMLMEDQASAWLAQTKRLHVYVMNDGRTGGSLFHKGS